MSEFALELDRVVICTTVDAPETRMLEAIGLKGFGGVTRHGDPGSTSTSFLFSSRIYLGLLRIHDEDAARRILSRWP